VSGSGSFERVGKHLRLQYGKPLLESDRNPAGSYPAYGANGVKARSDRFLRDEPSIIIGRKGSAGEVTLSENRYWPLDVTYFLDFDRTRHDLRYLFYLLTWLDLPKLAKGVKPGLNREDVYNLVAPFPSLAVQHRIVALLDDAFEGIAAVMVRTEQNVLNANDLFRVARKALFSNRDPSWTIQSIAAICENLDGRRRPVTKRDRVPGDVPYYGASGVVDHVEGHLFDEDLLLVSEDGANLLARTYPIAFSISGPSWVNNHAHALRFPDKRTQKYVEHYLNSIDLEPYVTGMAQPKLNQGALNKIPVPMAPVDRQAEIVASLEQLHLESQDLLTVLERKLAVLVELKQSLLARAFGRELTRGPLAA
jgi:type I restriction enzyme, S subunit